MTSGSQVPRRGPLERFLALFADVRPGEAVTALLLTLDVFLLLTCYYIIKPVREAFILTGSGAEVKSYASAVMVVVLLFFIPAYGAFANRVNRVALIAWVTAFFIANLLIFYLLAQLQVPYLDLAFFVWVGIFNVMITAQFWSFANDLYTPEEGKRLFAIIAFGSTLGAILGSGIAGALIGPLGIHQLLLVAAAILSLCIVLTIVVHRREGRRRAQRTSEAPPQEPLGKEGGFRLVLQSRYLMLIALLIMLFNFVNTNGEYILGKTVALHADALIAGGAGGADPQAFKGNYIGSFYAGFFTWVNTLTALIQLFLVSRILKWFGVRWALFFLPVVALGGYALLAAGTVLGTVRVVKVLENSIDYSLQNTTRHALFLPTSRDAKYKAKAAIDTFFWRAGDVLSAAVVLVGSSMALATRHFAAVNVFLVAFWLVIVWLIGREHAKLTAAAPVAREAADRSDPR